MAPRVINYTPGSVIYFNGDKSDSVYLLKSGKVQLTSIDIENQNEVCDIIKTGEFFGVKSGLIRYPREDTAITAADSTIIQFYTNDFEQLINKNVSIIMTMLKVFSNQLRKMHSKIEHIVGERNIDNPIYNFFLLGDFYLKERRYDEAVTTFNRFLKYYGDYKDIASLAKERLDMADKAKKTYGNGGGPVPNLTPPDQGMFFAMSSSGASYSENKTKGTDNDISVKIDSANSLINKEKYSEAYEILNELASESNISDEYKKEIVTGKITVLFHLEKYKDTIQSCLNYLKQYPNTNNKANIFYYLGISYGKTGDNFKAKEAYKVALSSTDDSKQIYKDIQKAMSAIE